MEIYHAPLDCFTDFGTRYITYVIHHLCRLSSALNLNPQLFEFLLILYTGKSVTASSQETQEESVIEQEVIGELTVKFAQEGDSASKISRSSGSGSKTGL